MLWHNLLVNLIEGRESRMRQGFDNEKYISLQAEHIKERIAQFGGKLYLEFGGCNFQR